MYLNNLRSVQCYYYSPIPEKVPQIADEARELIETKPQLKVDIASFLKRQIHLLPKKIKRLEYKLRKIEENLETAKSNLGSLYITEDIKRMETIRGRVQRKIGGYVAIQRSYERLLNIMSSKAKL